MILYNTPSCCFEERAGMETKKDGWCVCSVLSSYTIVAFSHTTCYYSPSNQICRARANAGLLSWLPLTQRRGWAVGTPLWTGSWNNSDHSWQQRMSGEYTHIWHGTQMSFHLRRTLKGDRLHPSCQADRLAGGEDSGWCAQKPVCSAKRNDSVPWLTEPKMIC